MSFEWCAHRCGAVRVSTPRSKTVCWTSPTRNGLASPSSTLSGNRANPLRRLFFYIKNQCCRSLLCYSLCNAEAVPKEILTNTQFSVALCYNLADSRRFSFFRPSVKAVSSTCIAIVTILFSAAFAYCAGCGLLLNGTIVGIGRAFCPCAARSCLFRLVSSQNGTLRALTPHFADSLLLS